MFSKLFLLSAQKELLMPLNVMSSIWHFTSKKVQTIGSAVRYVNFSKMTFQKYKKNICHSNISAICRLAFILAITLNFCVRCDIAYIITSNFVPVNSGCFELLHHILPFSTDLAGRPHNSVSTNLLLCNKLHHVSEQNQIFKQLEIHFECSLESNVRINKL